MKTDDLIERLARDARPLTPLRPPWAWTRLWLVVGAANVAVVGLVLVGTNGLNAAFATPRFLVEQVAALAVALTAAVAALASTVPGYPRRTLWLPALPLGVWLAVVLVGAASEYPSVATGTLEPHWVCSAAILAGGSTPAAVLVVMLRRGVPLTPRFTMALAALAAASLANISACAFDPFESSLGVLVWHGATVVAVVGLAIVTGRFLLARQFPAA